MLRTGRRFLAFLIVVLASSGSAWAQASPVSASDAAAWAQYLVPLPRSLSISENVQLSPSSVAILPSSHSDIVVNQAIGELRESIGLAKTTPNPANPAFTISLQLGGAESTPIQTLKNSDQAYLIFPEAGNNGLRIVALGVRGLYYGAKTVQQLIAARRGPGVVQMPILTVTDWPELTDRGVWGNDSFARTRWMADRKLNYQEQISARGLDGNCVGYASAKSGYERMYTEGPYYGVEPCHAVLHLEQVAPSNLFTCFPNLKGVGNIDPLVWCYSQPEGPQVLGQWIADLKQLPHSRDVDVWMSENLHGKGGCKCAACSLTNRSALEARVIVAGWKQAMQAVGPMGLRILTSETTRGDNDDIVLELANEPTVKIWQYDSLITYMVREQSIVDSNLRQWAAAGRYLGVCPLISPTSQCWQPWTCPQFVHYRLQEHASKNLSGIMAYPTPGIHCFRFNTEALAEWAWNPSGRSVREFTQSWAVRQGLSDPAKFADWVELLGPVSWDVYGSEFPRGIKRNNKNCGPIATALKNATLQELGQVKLTIYPAPWADIKDVAQFNADVCAAAKALDLAKTMDPEYYYETLVVHGYVTALRALYELKSLVVGGAVAQDRRALAANYFYIYVSGIKQAKDALPKWMQAIGAAESVSDSVALLDGEITQMTQLASELGCPISSSTTLVPVTSIPEAKKAVDGTFASLGSVVVTSDANGSYVQQIGGAPVGIKVQTALSLASGVPVSVLGSMGTVGGERVLNATMVLPLSTAGSAAPLAVKTFDLGGTAFGRQPAVMEYRMVKEDGKWVRRLLPINGLNNVGTLVKVAGKVTAVGADYFYLDDGCRCDDDSGNFGVRVICGSIAKPVVGEMLVLTGISSSYYERGQTWRAIVLPSASSIIPI